MNAILFIAPNGRFTAVPRTIGSTHEEIEALARGEIPEERAEQIRKRLFDAAIVLQTAQHQGAS